MDEKEIVNSENAGRQDQANFEMDINADDNIRGTTHLNDPILNGEEELVGAEVDKLEAELKEQKEKYLRLFADFDNAKRRHAKERMELMQTAGKEILISLLDVLDDMERAEKQFASTNDIKLVKEGSQIVFNKFRNLLQSRGLKPMESIGQEFDVEKHEAITEIPAASNDMKGKVVDEVMKGYYLNDRIIRHAKAIVGK